MTEELPPPPPLPPAMPDRPRAGHDPGFPPAPPERLGQDR